MCHGHDGAWSRVYIINFKVTLDRGKGFILYLQLVLSRPTNKVHPQLTHGVRYAIPWYRTYQQIKGV